MKRKIFSNILGIGVACLLLVMSAMPMFGSAEKVQEGQTVITAEGDIPTITPFYFMPWIPWY